MRAWGWATKLAFAIGGVGYLWTLLCVAWPLMGVIWRPPALDQQPYEIPGDRAYGDVGEMHRRLRGWPVASHKTDRKPCFSGSAVCQDAEPLVRGRGPKNGSTATFWISKTVNDGAFLGRYVTDLWYLTQAGTGAIGFSRAIQHGDNTRLIERSPPPAPPPPGWRLLQRGQCAHADVRPLDDEGTIGRFVIDLPADEDMRISSGPEGKGKWVPVADFLAFGGREVRHVQSTDPATPDAFHYRTEHAGRHELTIRRTDPPQERVSEGGWWTRYTVMVMWGACTYGCGFAMDGSECYEGNRDD
jgi:hypothetical protein